MVKCVCDAGENHAASDANDADITDVNHIGVLNPFRYRGYFYDVETGLYYLQTRYYDPETSRFITIDGISYINLATINGLNLYAYCGNNPVMRTDGTGTEWWKFWEWDWAAIGRAIAGAVITVVGGIVTIATLPAAMFVPGGGILTQVGVSATMYGVYMVGSAFDSTIKEDMDRIHWNPFNSDETLVMRSEKVSFYKGTPVFRINGSRSGSFFAIGLRKGASVNDLKHEWGHGPAYWIVGPLKGGLSYALPSAEEWGGNHWQGLQNYYRRPWEAIADIFGGANTQRAGFNATTTHDQEIAKWYLAVSAFFGPLSYLFLY